MFDWLFPSKKINISEEKPAWEYSEDPVYEKELRETIDTMEDILTRIDEIKALIDEMKAKENE